MSWKHLRRGHQDNGRSGLPACVPNRRWKRTRPARSSGKSDARVRKMQGLRSMAESSRSIRAEWAFPGKLRLLGNSGLCKPRRHPHEPDGPAIAWELRSESLRALRRALVENFGAALVHGTTGNGRQCDIEWRACSPRAWRVRRGLCIPVLESHGSTFAKRRGRNYRSQCDCHEDRSIG